MRLHQTWLFACLSLCSLQEAAWGQEDADSNAPTIQLQVKHVLKCQGRPCRLSFSGDGSRFAYSEDRSIRVWSTRSWTEVGGFTADKGSIVGDLSPNGRIAAFAESCVKEEIFLLDVASRKVFRTLHGRDRTLSGLAVSPDSKTIASSCDCDGVGLWDVETGKTLGHIPVKFQQQEWSEYSPIFSPEGGLLAIVTRGGTVHLLDVKKRQQVRQFVLPHARYPWSPAFSPDGRFLAVGALASNIVVVWDIQTGKVLWELKWPRIYLAGLNIPDEKRPSGVEGLAFSADGRSLLASCNDGWLRVWELATGKIRFRAETKPALLAAAPAGSLIATATAAEDTRQVFLWDWRTCVPPLGASAPVNPEKVWANLGSADATAAYQQIRELGSIPNEALAFLDKRLPVVIPMKPPALERLVQELDDDQFEVRDRARRHLEELGDVAHAVLSRALSKNPSPEVSKRVHELLDTLADPLAANRLRFIRAVEILEAIGSPKSRGVLERLAAGDPGHLLTREARVALQRLNAN